MKKKPATDYASYYSDGNFWKKLRDCALSAGRELVGKVLLLYYAGTDSATPMKARAIAWSALGYFILPLDMIPDITPGVGYSDDFGAVVLALGIIAAHIKPRHKETAEAKLADWFGPRAK